MIAVKSTGTEGRRTGGAEDDFPVAGLAEMFELAPNFMVMLSGHEHRFTQANPAYLRMVGRDAVVGQTVSEALPEMAEQGILEILDRVYETGEPFTATELPVNFDVAGRVTEHFVSFVYQPVRAADGAVCGIAVHGMDVTDHVRDRRAIEAREAYYESLLTHSDDSMSVISPDGTVLYQSASVERLLGWTAAELVGSNSFDLIHPDDAAAVQEQMTRVVAEPGRAVLMEVRLRHRDGSWKDFEALGHARVTGGGLEIVSTARDVTRRKSAEQNAHVSDERFRTLVEFIPQLVWTTTPDGYHDYFNQRWYDYTGMAPTGDQGWNWKDYLHPDDYDRSVAAWTHCLQTGEAYHVEYRFKRASDGAYRWFIGRAFPLRDADGNIVRWFGTCTDIDDERRALEAARQSEERFLALTRATTDVIWDWDLATDAVWWNGNLARVLLHDPQGLPSTASWSDVLHPDDEERVIAGVRGAIDSGDELWTDEYRFIRGDGSIAEIHDRGLVIRDGDGRPIRMIGSMQDVTDHNQLEEELRQAQKIEAIGKLAGGIAHDFNNLLTVITSYSELVLGELPQDAPNRADIEEIRRAADRAASLTRQLLAFSRRQVLQPRDLDLNSVVAEVEAMLRRIIGERITLVFEPGRNTGAVRADPGQLEQVLMNLALNARDAMPGGGTLRLATSRLATSRAGKGEFVELTVSDSGTGMDERTMARVFEPFFTTKSPGEGTGLGLSTVHGIVTQSGGRIEVASAPGDGTTFRIRLPAVRALTPQQEASPGASVAAGAASGTILLVEDENAVRLIVRRSLTRQGYDVVEACNGEEALGIMKDRAAEIDLILTDLVMPAMGGRALVQGVRAQFRSPPPVIYMSGYAEEDALPSAEFAGGDVLLEKPFTIQELLAVVGRAVGPRVQRSG